MKYFYFFKLWIWWKFILRKNEFSKRLDSDFLYKKFKGKSLIERNKIIYFQRDLAHDLDNGLKVENVERIKKAQIKLF